MSSTALISPDQIRNRFSRAMSAMYRQEVPLYGDLIKLVSEVNAEVLESHPEVLQRLDRSESLAALSEERHGAIRLGSAEELSTMRRLFAVMGMYPVGYYDLTEAGIPVHSTAFRPVSAEALRANPFRVFTSLLCTDLITNPALREQAETIIAQRQIFNPEVLALIERCAQNGGLNAAEAEAFITSALETFRWHSEALVDRETYQQLHDSHRLIADIVSFKGPHINHLTPRTLDIDRAQQQMIKAGMAAKAVIEGPASRKHPILLRQTSFKALEETVAFIQPDGRSEIGAHTARFGEIEQRGIALTPKGRELYDRLLDDVRLQMPQPESDPAHYQQILNQVFSEFPDDLEVLRQDELAYFEYRLSNGLPETVETLLTLLCEQSPDLLENLNQGLLSPEIDGLIALGLVKALPITYEDFLPVSAAGIFQSNLGSEARQDFKQSANQTRFEQALGCEVSDPFGGYALIQQHSLKQLARK